MIRNKTIFIAHNWSNGGVNEQSKALAIALSKHNKVVFLSAKKQGQNSFDVNDNLTVYEWPGKRPTGMKDFWFAVSLMRKFKPDVIHSNFAANNIMLLSGWLTGVKVRMFTFHTMVEQYIADNQKLGLKQKINIKRNSFFYSLATHILPCSSAAKKDLLKYYKVRESKLIVNPNGVLDSGKRNVSNNSNVGFLGRLHRSKGVDLLLDAFVKVVQQVPGSQLLIAGGGELDQQLKERVEVLKVGGSVQFVGKIASSGVYDFINSLNVLTVPSRTDNLPTVVLEAFSTATPVICSNSGGMPDMVEHGENGMLFERENVDELATRIVEVLKHRELRNKLAANARKKFEEKYSIQAYIDRFENILAGAVKK